MRSQARRHHGSEAARVHCTRPANFGGRLTHAALVRLSGGSVGIVGVVVVRGVRGERLQFPEKL